MIDTRRAIFLIGCLLSLCSQIAAAQQTPAAQAAVADDPIALTADSRPQPGVPQGKTFEFTFDRSTLFPGTRRKITVYVPVQYRAERPACVYVGLDALLFEAPVVFDNLIHRGEMPVTIAVGVSPGKVESARTQANPRFNRSNEFDGLNGHLAQFLLDEVLPEVERRKTPDGLPILLSKDPNDRAAGGASTGGVGSFTLAWERPDAFRRVFTAIGTFVGMRGGDRYPVLVRKTEPKPIRIFMQDGSKDGLPGSLDEVGDWWMGNLTMQRALQFAGYEVQNVWGDGAHDNKHATAVFPEAMRWLWKDWPKPITAGQSQNTFLQAVLIPGESWQPATPAQEILARMSQALHAYAGPEGREYRTDAAKGELYLKTSQGHTRKLDSGLQAPTAVALSPDWLWLAVAEGRSHWGYSYLVRPDGTVEHRQQYYWFHVPDTAETPGTRAWVYDRDGRLYAATNLGVQIFDRNGRVRAILPVPGGAAEAIAFGGSALDTLYVRSKDNKVYSRKVKASGVLSGAAPLDLPTLNPG